MRRLLAGVLVLVAVLALNGCVVTKKSYTQLLSDYTALKQKQKKTSEELDTTKSKTSATISEQKNRIAALEQELADEKSKYEADMEVAVAKEETLTESVATLKAQSSETTQKLMDQVSDLQTKYQNDMTEKNQAIESLKQAHREKVEGLNNQMDANKQASDETEAKLRSELAQLQARTAEQEKALKALSDQADQLEEQLKDEIEKGEITLKRYKTKTIINMDHSILFGSGRADLKRSVAVSLKKIAGALQNFPENSIQIEGHTDNVPIHNDRFPSNWELSSARALAVLRNFTEKLDIDPRRLSAVGYGEYQPLAPNDTPENRRQNRRVDIVILPK